MAIEIVQADPQKEILRVIQNVSAALTNMQLYSDHHPQVRHYLENAHFELTKFLLDKPETTLLLVNDRLVCDGRPLRQEGSLSSQFIRILGKLAIERVTFVSGITAQELQDFLRALLSPTRQSVRSGPHVRLGKLEIRVEGEDEPREENVLSEEEKHALLVIRGLCEAKIEDVREICARIARRQTIDAKALGEVVDTFVRAFDYGVSPLQMLATLRSADEYTFTHVVNVCILTMSQAEALGFRGNALYEIGIASALHDAGKLLIPPEILHKPGGLTPQERSIMETHTIRGAHYVLGLKNVPKLSVLAALEHHLKFDGSGYPVITKGWQPHIVSQMIAISDVFDALRSRRCYKEPTPMERIVEILRSEKGSSFHPLLVDNFLNLIRR